MVVGAFPAAKLGLLAIRQVAKPIATVIKNRAKQRPFFRKYVCMPPAQLYNWVEVKTKMWALNLGKPVNVPPLNEAMAIELGANLLGEFIIFTVGAGALLFEYSRQSGNDAKKQEALRQEKIEIVNALSEMAFRMERQDTQLREMSRALADLESRSIFRWHQKEPIHEYPLFDPNNPDQTPTNENNYEGLYDPNSGFVFKALNFLETQIFVDARKTATKVVDDQSEVEELMTLAVAELQPYVVTIPQDDVQLTTNESE